MTSRFFSKFQTVIASAFFSVLFTCGAFAEDSRPVLPRPTYENTFYLFFRCYDIPKVGRAGVSVEDQRAFFQDFMDRIGPHRIYTRVALRGPEMDEDLAREFGFTDERGENGWHRFWNHWEDFEEACKKDRRRLQWFNNGDIRTSRRTHFGDTYASVSRYSTEVQEIAQASYKEIAEKFLEQSPSPLETSCDAQASMLVGPVEASLLETGIGDGLFCDYSPLTIAEFRDWLTHKGLYAKGEKYEGQGRLGGERFADDPAPDVSATEGKTFNQIYGTRFRTWSLRYWDLELFDKKMKMRTRGMPTDEEKGHIPQGFDAPRAKTEGAPLWMAWNNDDPSAPGFRQVLVANYISDFHKALREAGVPKNRIFSAVIGHSDEPYHRHRQFVDADPGWVAKTDWGSPGFTAYGTTAFNEECLARMASFADDPEKPNWALVEWHPHPFPPKSFLTTVEEYRGNLESVWKYRPHMLEVEGWSGLTFGGNWGYETRSTNLETAFKQWLDDMPDRPYYSKKDIDYAPPRVVGVRTKIKGWMNKTCYISWSDLMWEGLSYTWEDWHEFAHFAVYGVDKNGRESLITQVIGNSVRLPNSFAKFKEFKVVVVKKGKKPDPGHILTRKDLD
ncbi:hypothetical protein ACFL1X_07195 [Candidatus Hydrogenedentota bacterium]